MARERDWTEQQPHKASNGRFTSRDYAKEHPEKVVWVKVD